MSILDVVILLLIAGLCGALGQAIAGTRGGFFVSIVLGFIGALFGMWLARLTGLPELLSISIDGQATFPVVWAIIGSALFVAIIHLLAGPWRSRGY